MSQTRAWRLYSRWLKYARRCADIGAIPGNRMPLSAERAALTVFLKLPKYTPPPPPPTIILHGWPG